MAKPLSIIGVFTDVTVTHDAMGTNSPSYCHRCWLLKLVLVTIWTVLSVFGLKFGLEHRSTLGTFYHSTSEDLRLQSWMMLTHSFFLILYPIMWVFNAVLPEGSKVTVIQCWFSALSLTCRDFSGSFNYIMDCRCEIYKFLQVCVDKRS